MSIALKDARKKARPQVWVLLGVKGYQSSPQKKEGCAGFQRAAAKATFWPFLREKAPSSLSQGRACEVNPFRSAIDNNHSTLSFIDLEIPEQAKTQQAVLGLTKVLKISALHVEICEWHRALDMAEK